MESFLHTEYMGKKSHSAYWSSISFLYVAGVASALKGILESPWFQGCRFEDYISMLLSNKASQRQK